MAEQEKDLKKQLLDMAESLQSMAVANRKKEPQASYISWKIAELLGKAAKQIEGRKKVHAEIEGGGATWFFVCDECHTAIDTYDKFCRQCGGEIIWEGEGEDEGDDGPV